MLEAGFTFASESELQKVVSILLELPPNLRPMYFSSDEKKWPKANLLSDSERLQAFLRQNQAGFFLIGSGVTYSFRIANGKPLLLDCFLEVAPEGIEALLVGLSRANPEFGFACSTEEREARNRLIIRQGANTVESWVGRDTRLYVPGLYWLTLAPERLLKLHQVPLSALAAIARQHIELPQEQHLFRFYDAPGEWASVTAVGKVATSVPGIFNIGKVKLRSDSAKTFPELQEVLREWR
jgi:hypothetical protein